MSLHLRQVALVARDMNATLAELRGCLGNYREYRDPHIRALGLCNTVVDMGEALLEVVSPLTPGTTAGRLLDKRGRDGAGYMVILETDEIASDVERCKDLGVRIVADIDLPDMRAIHLHPKDTGGAMLSFDQPAPPGSWRWAGPEWTPHPSGSVRTRLRTCRLSVADPELVAKKWSDLVQRPFQKMSDGLRISLDSGALEFVAGASSAEEGLSVIEVCSTEWGEVSERGICGVRIRKAPWVNRVPTAVGA